MTQATHTFAELLRQYREARDISKADLARALDVSPGYMYQLETGRTTAPQMDRVRALAQALRLCPELIAVRGQYHRYHELSEQVFAILGDVTPDIQCLALDEAWLDVTGSQRLFGDGPTIALAIKRRVKDETGLTISVGVGPKKVARGTNVTSTPCTKRSMLNSLKSMRSVADRGLQLSSTSLSRQSASITQAVVPS